VNNRVEANNVSSESNVTERKQESISSVTIEENDDVKNLATPAVRRIAKEYGIKLINVSGTGKGGRITKEDILEFANNLKQKISSFNTTNQPSVTSISTPEAKASSRGPYKEVKLNPIQKAMSKNMTLSLEIPHFLLSDEISFEALSRMRTKINKRRASLGLSKISFTPFLLKSFSLALNEFPVFNSQYSESNLLYYSDQNIGIAVDTPKGLVVPTLRKVNEMSILDISENLSTIQTSAIKATLPPDAFQGATVTLSNIGSMGGSVCMPVIPPGTVFIAAVGNSKKVLRLGASGVFEESVITVSLAADHRVIDGLLLLDFVTDGRKILKILNICFFKLIFSLVY
jgi:2-oxoisovalerate dehydrogenase E2 component (dihydrolipoyl transacylase)